MKPAIGWLLVGVTSTAALLMALYVSFPTGNVLKRRSAQGWSLELREAGLRLHRLPWRRAGDLYLLGPDGRDRAVPVHLYADDVALCVAVCGFRVGATGFELLLPKDRRYTGRVE